MQFQHYPFRFPMLFLFAAFVFTSCEKDPTTEITPVPDIWARLIATRESRTVIAGGDTTVITKEIADARFLSSLQTPTTYVQAGAVKLNETGIDLMTDNSYHEEQAAGLGLAAGMHWQVQGKFSIPAASYEDTVTFPSYTGTLPYVIDKNAGISLLLDPTTIGNADSVRILINDGTGSGTGVVELLYGNNAGTVTIPPSSLSGLANVSNHTAVIAVMPYAGIIKVFGNKGFFFVRESHFYMAVNIH